jgi:hypothetical protein
LEAWPSGGAEHHRRRRPSARDQPATQANASSGGVGVPATAALEFIVNAADLVELRAAMALV